MRKVLFILSVALLAAGSASSQNMGTDYKTAVGIKFYPGSLSVKHFIKDNKAIEGLAYFWQYGNRITGLYEIHGDINGAPGLKWYVGPGAHIGFWNTTYKNKFGSSGAYIGVDGVLGLDYKISNAPINLSLDWQPSFNFGTSISNNDGYGFEGGWGGFAIRYTF